MNRPAREALRRAAEAVIATDPPGEWKYWRGAGKYDEGPNVFGKDGDCWDGYVVCAPDGDEDARFIAAANPQAILSLLAQVDDAERERDALSLSNQFMRGELDTAYAVIEELPESALDLVDSAKLMRVMKAATESERHEHVTNKVDAMRVEKNKALKLVAEAERLLRGLDIDHGAVMNGQGWFDDRDAWLARAGGEGAE